MAGSSFGNLFRITTWGESHGKGIGVILKTVFHAKLLSKLVIFVILWKACRTKRGSMRQHFSTYQNQESV